MLMCALRASVNVCTGSTISSRNLTKYKLCELDIGIGHLEPVLGSNKHQVTDKPH